MGCGTTSNNRMHEAQSESGFASKRLIYRVCEPFAPGPAAHSIFKNPREIDAYGGECGGAADGFGIGICGRGARTRAGTKSNRATEYKATTRAERAQSLRVPAKIGSYIIVQPHPGKNWISTIPAETYCACGNLIYTHAILIGIPHQ